MNLSAWKETQKSKLIVETYIDKSAGEQWEDMGRGWNDCKKQGPVENYGGSSVPYDNKVN